MRRMGHIVVVGLMGSGKTTVGAALARALARPHRDSDRDIARSAGTTAREIAAAEGIEHLHALELDHLLDALQEPNPTVVSAAASVIDTSDARAALADPAVNVVWLRGDPSLLAVRAARDDHRPSPEPPALQAARRDPLFAEVADHTIDVGDLTPDEIVAALLG
jgi:shikimate kinase